jgi:hypothetical protein
MGLKHPRARWGALDRTFLDSHFGEYKKNAGRIGSHRDSLQSCPEGPGRRVIEKHGHGSTALKTLQPE